MVAFPSAHFVCFWFDEKWAVKMSIVGLEGMALKGDEVTLGAGRGCMMKQGLKLKQFRALMMYRSWILVMNRRSHCLSCLVMEALCLTIARLDKVERSSKGEALNRSQAIAVEKEGRQVNGQVKVSGVVFEFSNIDFGGLKEKELERVK